MEAVGSPGFAGSGFNSVRARITIPQERLGIAAAIYHRYRYGVTAFAAVAYRLPGGFACRLQAQAAKLMQCGLLGTARMGAGQ